MSSDYQLEATLYLPFTTRAFATGIPTVLAGSPAIDIYEDVTATPIVTGETLAVSLNSVAGFNMLTVTATAATGFEAGKSYTAIIEAGTVDSVSVVGEVVAHFTLGLTAAEVLTADLADVYAANGAAPTLQQAIMAVHQMLMAFAISGTSISVKKLDGSTEAFVATLDDATVPTQAIRS